MDSKKYRVGLIVPSSNTSMEDEFREYLPSDVGLHVSRVKLRRVNVEALSKLKSQVVEAADLLADADVDVIMFGCTSGSLIGGLGYDREIIRMVEEKVGVRTLTTSTAVVNALKRLGVEKVSVATPYIEEVNLREKIFLEANGFEVVKIKGLGLESNLDIGRVEYGDVYSLALEVYDPRSQGLFISCTNLRTFKIIKRLEEELGKPVVTSNQASLWATLRSLGLNLEIGDLGRLFKF